MTIGGFIHNGEPWVMPNTIAEVSGNAWSDWLDLHNYPWHVQLNRSGGVAEYPSLKLFVSALDSAEPINGCALEVQLADAPAEKNVVISFTEKSESGSIAFLVPVPLREKAQEFETGSQMTARQVRWANEATGGQPIKLNKFDIITQLWGQYDPALERQEAALLKQLGFGIIGNLNPQIARQLNLRSYGTTEIYTPDPEQAAQQWNRFAAANLTPAASVQADRARLSAHWVISDEVSALDLRSVEKDKLNAWFRAFLKSRDVTDAELGQSIDRIEYPAAEMFANNLPPEAPLNTRRVLYYAAKFEQWWSARQIRQTSDLIRGTLPGMKTEILLPSHGFLGNAWSPYNIGMSYRMLDIFETGRQQPVDQLSAEDWLGLNHMYGPNYTWTGGQTFGYYNALIRSAIGTRPIMLRGLITPSDDAYLRLKAYSSLGQGAKSFFFWTFGPTYIGTENYWSDLRNEYDGIAKLNRALAKAEDVLYPAKTVTDPVAILYSVSHDIWNTNNQAAFVEKRLLWHALRHLQIQPNFLSEEDIEAGALKNYKVLYITDWCLSRKSSAAIDNWVKSGGVLYLSAGAATRDEFNEPYTPPFADTVWESNAAQNLVSERHTYNERTELPFLKPLTTARVTLNAQSFDLPVIGTRLKMRENQKSFASFADGSSAGQIVPYGNGRIIAAGFMPMLAYGKLAGFKPETLSEKWTPEPREIIKAAIDAAQISPVAQASVPVVETNLLTGSNGSALVLANYTYLPIKSLTIDVNLPAPIKHAVSIEGKPVKIQLIGGGRWRLTLPLEWTDIILLK